MSTRRSSRRLAGVVAAGLLLAGCGDPAPTAVVAGQTYVVAVVRDFTVAEADLSPYGTIDRASDPGTFLDGQAFAVRGVDGRDFLLVRANPTRSDDLGSWGAFVGLFADAARPLPSLCGYFVASPPSWC